MQVSLKLLSLIGARSRASAPSSTSLLSTPTTKYNPLSDRNTISLHMPKHRIESLSPGPVPAQRKRPQFESLRPPPLPPNNKSATAPTVAGLAFRISCIPSRITKEQFLQILHTLPYDSLMGDNGGQRNVLGWSFAPSAPSTESKSYRTATVTFGSLPTGFRFQGSSVNLDIGFILDDISVVVDKQFYGLTPLYSSEQPTVDIIAVTGLAGHAFGSWKSRGGCAMWLRDFLPEATPTARIMTYGYDSRLLNNNSTASIHEFSRNFLEALTSARAGNEERQRPIIFIGHSLGGLVIKEALIAAEQSDDQNKSIFLSCYALLLFGVPNKGLEVASLRSMVKGQPNSRLIEDLDKASNFLRRHNFFWKFQKVPDTRVISIYETRPTPTVQESTGWRRTGPEVLMVNRESASYPTPESQDDIFSIDANHSEIVKFGNRASPDYNNVRSRIIRLVLDGQAVVSKRFNSEPECAQGTAGLVTGITSNFRSMFVQFEGASQEIEKNKILEWLSQIEYIKHHRNALEGILENTGRWLLRKTQFYNWKSSDASSILWLHGIPGAGKTKLTCMVIQSMISSPETGQNHQTAEPLVYFYCNRSDPQRQDPTAIMRSIVKQMSLAWPRAGLPKPVVEAYNDRAKNGLAAGHLVFQECFDLLILLLDLYPRTTIIIDGLDESDPMDRWRLLEALTAIMHTSTNSVKIFISSRDDTDIRLKLEEVPNLYIDAQDNREDIERFIQREVQLTVGRRRLWRLPEAIRSRIVSVILAKANGMFQWVNLQITHLDGMRFEEDIMENLGKLPKSLEAAYFQIFDGMRKGTSREWEVTKRALMWIMCSRIPLTKDLWTDACYWPTKAPENGADTLFELCQNLVTWDSQLGAVKFSHLSVHEYLENVIDVAEAHAMAAECCLSIFDPLHWTEPRSQSTREPIPSQFTREPINSQSTWPPILLVEYSTIFWTNHVGSSYTGVRHMSPVLVTLLTSFMGMPTAPGQGYRNWFQRGITLTGYTHMRHYSHCGQNPRFHSKDNSLIREILSHSDPRNPLFLASYLHFGAELPELWGANTVDNQCRNGIGETLLYVACSRGNEGAVDILLGKGALADTFSPDPSSDPLSKAMSEGYVNMATKLLEKGENIYHADQVLQTAVAIGPLSVVEAVMDWYPNFQITEAVLKAAVTSRHGDTVLTVVLNRTPPINVIEAVVAAVAGGLILARPLLAARSNGHPSLKIMHALLSIHRNIRITEAAMVAAAQNLLFGSQMMQILLASDHNVVVTEAVMLAVAFGNCYQKLEMMQMLLARDPNIVITEVVMVALALGYGCQSLEIMQTLLARDPNIVITEAVMVAVALGYGYQKLEMMRTLLARDPNIVVTEAVVVAVASGNDYQTLEAMQILLARDPNFVVTEAVMVAVALRYGYQKLEIMQALLAREPNIVVTEAVMVAVASEDDYQKLEVMQMLLARDPNIVVTEAIIVAVLLGYSYQKLEIMQMLLARDANIVVTEAVMVAVASENDNQKLEIMHMLLARDPNIVATEAVMVAVASGSDYQKLEIMHMLLARDPNIVATEAVMVAVASGSDYQKLEVMQMLLARDPNIVVTEAVVMAVASENDNQTLEAMQMLLASDPDIVVTEAVMVAVALGYSYQKLEIMQMLLASNPNIVMTEAVTAAVASGNDYQKMEAMITEAIVKAAAGDFWNGKKMWQALLVSNPNIKIPGGSIPWC